MTTLTRNSELAGMVIVWFCEKMDATAVLYMLSMNSGDTLTLRYVVVPIESGFLATMSATRSSPYAKTGSRGSMSMNSLLASTGGGGLGPVSLFVPTSSRAVWIGCCGVVGGCA